MDENRFDSLARSAATWTSRRRALGGLAGVALANIFRRPDLASAQCATPTSCGQVGDPNQLGDIVSAANFVLPYLANIEQYRLPATVPTPGPDATGTATPLHPSYRPHFFDFAAHLKSLYKKGLDANNIGAQWLQSEVDSYLGELANVIPTVSIGYAAALFTNKPPDASVSEGIRAQVTTDLTTSKECAKCVLGCLGPALECYDKCSPPATGIPADDAKFSACVAKNACVSTYVACFFGEKQEADNLTCYQELVQACEDNPDGCCGGACIP